MTTPQMPMQMQPQSAPLGQPQATVPTGDNPELKYVDIDFSAGIFSDQYGGLRSVPDGAATPNTYGCFSPPAGGLAPLPRASTDTHDTWTLTPTQIVNAGAHARPANLAGATDANRGYGRQFLLDAFVHGPVSSTAAGSGEYAADVPFAIYGYAYSLAGSGAAYPSGSYSYYASFCRQVPASSAHCSVHELVSVATGRSLVVGPGNLAISMAKTTSGYRPTVLALLSSPNPSPNVFFYALPNPASPAGTAPYSDDLAGASYVFAVSVIAHQGRAIFVCADHTNALDFTTEGTTFIPEQLYYGLYGQFDLDETKLAGPSVVVEENPSGITAWGSINANQLILIKNAGGAVEITGSLDNPTVLRLPGIRSTGGLPTIPCNVPGHNFRYPGLVYGTSQGIFMWAGLDNSEAISENLDPTFWLWNRNWAAARFGTETIVNTATPPPGMYGPLGRFAFVHPFLFAPNGFVCDFRSAAWWQIENPTTNVHYTHWHPSARPHKVWGFKGYIDDAENLAGQAFDLEQGQGVYLYESHPFKPSRNRHINCREIIATLVGRTNDTVQFTLTGLDDGTGGSPTRSATYRFTADGMKMIRLDTSLLASQVQIQITSTSNNSDDAPRVLAVSVGYYPTSIL